jgi:hypothetical protein
VKIKNLNKRNGGTIAITEINATNFEEYKKIVADLLFSPPKVMII